MSNQIESGAHTAPDFLEKDEPSITFVIPPTTIYDGTKNVEFALVFPGIFLHNDSKSMTDNTVELGNVATLEREVTPSKQFEEVLKPTEETWKRIVVVSNRLPFKASYDESQEKWTVKKSSGGLVTAMSPLLRENTDGKWIGWPEGTEKEGLEEALRTHVDGEYDVGVVTLTPQEQAGYYKGYSNEILWPLFHSKPDKVDFRNVHEKWQTYKHVNKKFADKIAEDAKSGDLIWVHDYHLTGVAKELRTMNIEQPTGFFLHIPFPTKEVFGLLPQREEMLQDLLSYDLLGFQTAKDRVNFLTNLAAFVPEAKITGSVDNITTVRYGGRTIRVGNFAISIDPEEFEQQAKTPRAQENKRRLEKVLHEDNDTQLIFNVGRQDYTKGFYEELRAYQKLLEEHPELVGKVVLMQLIVPSRESIDEYKEYKEKIIELYKQINKQFTVEKEKVVQTDTGEKTVKYRFKPVRQMHTSMGRERLLAHYGTDELIMSVPTLADGMNLVAKEFAVTGSKNGVLILGKNAGAAEEFKDDALIVDPENTDELKRAFERALQMPVTEREERMDNLSNIVHFRPVQKWANEQEDLVQQAWDEKKAA